MVLSRVPHRDCFFVHKEQISTALVNGSIRSGSVPLRSTAKKTPEDKPEAGRRAGTCPAPGFQECDWEGLDAPQFAATASDTSSTPNSQGRSSVAPQWS